MDIPRIVPQDVEFMTTYPVVGGRANERVLMVVLNTAESGRWLVYAPKVIQHEMEVEISTGFMEQRDYRNILLDQIPYSREMIINNNLYVLSDKEAFINLIALDSQHKRTVKKEEIEKLFGCSIE